MASYQRFKGNRMKKITNRIFKQLPKCIVIFLTVLSVNASALDQSFPLTNSLPQSPKLSHPPRVIPRVPDIESSAFVLMDANSGAILAQKNMNQRVAPASLTKLMTLYVASQALAQGQLKLTDMVHISKEAWSRGGSRMFVKEGSDVSVQDLLQGIIVASGNDACVALAEQISGDEKNFALLMNDTASHLGMKNSHFVDSTGLPNEGHYATAYDLAVLTRALINHFPEYYGWYKQKWIKYNNIRQPNRNRLLWRDPSVDGLKTGFTDDAGYCLIASAQRQGMRLISVVLGTPSDSVRANASQALLNWGYRYFKTHKLLDGNTSVTQATVWMAKKDKMSLGLANDLYVTVPTGSFKQIKATIEVQPKLEAPVKKGQVCGKIDVTLGDKLVGSAPLIALEDNKRAGWLSRTVDHIELFFKKIF